MDMDEKMKLYQKTLDVSVELGDPVSARHSGAEPAFLSSSAHALFLFSIVPTLPQQIERQIVSLQKDQHLPTAQGQCLLPDQKYIVFIVGEGTP